MKNLEDIVENVESKDDFILFVRRLIQDLRKNSEVWENKNLEDYLEAILSWTEDMDGYYLNNNIPIPKI